MILLRSFLSGHIRIKRTLEYYDAGIGPRVPFGGGFGPTVSANFAVALGDFTTLSSTSTMPTGGSISRAGNAMLYAVDGGVAKLTYAPNNLNTYSNDFSSWGGFSNSGASNPVVTPNYAAGPDNVAGSASRIVMDTGSTFGAISQIAPASVMGTTASAIVSIWLKSNTGATQTVGVFASNGGSTLASVTTEWQRFYYVAPSSLANNSTFRLRATNGATSAVVDIQAAFSQCELVTYQTSPSGTYYLNYPTPNTTSAYYGPRFDYDPVTLAAKGLLVEGTRTNLLTYSNTFTGTGWTNNANVNVTSTTATNSPDGTQNAVIATATAGAGAATVTHSVTTVVASTTYNYSIYLKANVGSTINLNISDFVTGQLSTSITPSTGACSVANSGPYSAVSISSENVGNGWWRYKITATQPSGQTGLAVRVIFPNNSDSVYLFGAQLEQANFASSYIPTVASSVARAAETFSLTGYANRLVEAFYIDEQTGANYSGNSALSTGTVTISPPTFGWVTSLRAYTNAYAGSISTPSWLSFSRAGNAMYYDSTGTLTYAPANLLQNSDGPLANLSNSSNVSNAGTPIAGFSNSIAFGNNSVDRLAYRNPTAYNTGTTYIASVYVQMDDNSTPSVGTNSTTGDFTFIINNSFPASVGVIPIGNNVFRCFGIFVSNAANTNTGVIKYTTQSSKSFRVTGYQLEPVTYQTAPSAYISTTSAAVYGPRYDYDPSTVPATPRGLLIEESRANLNFPALPSTSWTVKTNATFATEGIAPDGTASAVKVSATTTGGVNLNNGPFVVSATSASYSIYAKKGSGATTLNRFLVRNDTTATNLLAIDFNFDTGVSTYVIGSTGASSVYVGNGWWRITLSVSSGITSGNGIVIYAAASGASYNAGEFVYLWGAQLEAGSFATSYIPTTTASVTRAADVAQLTGSALTVATGSAFTSVTQASTFGMSATSPLPTLLNVSDGTAGNYIRLNSASSYGGRILIQASSVQQANITTGSAPSNNQVYRFGAALAASNFGASYNGGAISSASSGSMPTVNQAAIGNWFTSSGTFLNGYVQSLALYNTRLPDAILKQKSSVGAPY